MVSINAFKKLALSFPEVSEQAHFENTSFRIKQKIFASLAEPVKRACLKLSVIDQSSFCAFDDTVIYPVPNKWGKQGWTFIELRSVKKEMLADALTTAYCEVAPKKISKPYTDLRAKL